jgi:hypothetical protein
LKSIKTKSNDFVTISSRTTLFNTLNRYWPKYCLFFTPR